jgi:hypothetical protein
MLCFNREIYGPIDIAGDTNHKLYIYAHSQLFTIMEEVEEYTYIPTSMRVGGIYGGPTYIVCNHLAPLKYQVTGPNVEAFMYKITQDNTISIYWYDGTSTTRRFDTETRVETFARYYPKDFRRLTQLHEQQRRTLVSGQHAVNVTNFHLKIGTNLKNRIRAIPAIRRHTEISTVQLKFAQIVAKMDWLFFSMLYDPGDSVVPDDAGAIRVYTSAAKERDKMLTTVTDSNRAWTIFELRHQFRLTINDYFYSKLYRQPLQSHFSFATTLVRLDNVLEGLMTGADGVE